MTIVSIVAINYYCCPCYYYHSYYPNWYEYDYDCYCYSYYSYRIIIQMIAIINIACNEFNDGFHRCSYDDSY